jgi:hypothetical protein
MQIAGHIAPWKVQEAQQGNHTADPLQRSPSSPCQLAPLVDNGGQAYYHYLLLPAAQIIFPEYSCQGFHPTKWRDFTTTLDGPEVTIFKEACKRNKVGGGGGGGGQLPARSGNRDKGLRWTPGPVSQCWLLPPCWAVVAAGAADGGDASKT